MTGGAGFIGSNLVEALLDLGEVMVVDNLSTGNQANIDSLIMDGACFREANILDYERMVKVTHGVDVIFHHAALASVSGSIENPAKSNAVNVTGILNVLEARALGLSQVD